METTSKEKKFLKKRIEFLRGEIERLNNDFESSYSDKAKGIIQDRIKSRTADFYQCQNFLANIS